MQDNSSIATTSTDRDQTGLKAKRKLKLALPVATQEAEPTLTFNQSTSTFVLQGQLTQADETDFNSSSVSQARRNFFPKTRRTNFDLKGQHYYIRGRDNGKFMEDKCAAVPEFENCQNTSFYGVYDGHSTDTIAELLKDKLHTYILESFTQKQDNTIEQAITDGFERIESEAIKSLKQTMQIGGSTALCTVIKDNIVYTANAGDSQAVIIHDDGVKVLNNLHDFSNKKEESAVGERGGVILERGSTKRLLGELAISRSIGDYKYKEFISSAPEISEHQITPADNYLILATDGYWNVISPEKTASTIKLIQKEFKDLDSIEKISEYLIELACNTKSNSRKDNMILIIVDLKSLPDKKSPLGSQKMFADSP